MNKDILRELLDLLLNESGITFFEVEKSKVIFNLTKYFDPNFAINLETKDKNYSSLHYNSAISNQVFCFLTAMDFSHEKIKKLVALLENSIRSMNCFKLHLYELSSLRQSAQLLTLTKSNTNQTTTIRLNFQECPKATEG